MSARADQIQALAGLYLEACALDVQAFKPGNVSLRSPGHGMQANDFLRSAVCTADVITQPGLMLGERILQAVTATRSAVGCNTNLGIILLAAPLLQARLEFPHCALRAAVQRVLAAATRQDSASCCRAIALAAPGGLGELDRDDVLQSARLPLAALMRSAATRDLIASQYANGFRELFDQMLPVLDGMLLTRVPPGQAVEELYLHLLARYPDTHIARKHGHATARRVMCMVRQTRCDYLNAKDPDAAADCLDALDATLKKQQINPGTTADFCVVTFLSHRLQRQVVSNTGINPDTRRKTGPDRVEVPLQFISQRYVGENKWE